MVARFPNEALGRQAPLTRELVIDVVRAVHARFAEAHVVSGSRYSMGFGSQWRDLLDGAHDEVTKRGFQTHKLTPGGYKVPVVNGCLVYVWRVPSDPHAISKFASSPTRMSGLGAPTPPPMLFEADFVDEAGLTEGQVELAETAAMLEVVQDTMPLVLVMVHSSPRQLQSIEWAIAELDEAEKVTLHGRECIWEPEHVGAGAAAEGETFSDGAPVEPIVEPREQEASGTDA